MSKKKSKLSNLDYVIRFILELLKEIFAGLIEIYKKINPKYKTILFFFIISIILIKLKPSTFVPIMLFILIILIQLLTKVVDVFQSIGLEFGYFCTIMVGYLYGMKTGVIFGILFYITEVLEQMRTTTYPVDLVIKSMFIPSLGILGAIFNTIPIFNLGMTLTFIQIGILVPINFFLSEDQGLLLMWYTGFTVQNFLLFKFIAPILVGCCSIV